MNFNTQIRKKLTPLFLEYGLKEIDVQENFFEFESACINLIIGRSSLDVVNVFTVILIDGTTCPVSDNAVKIVFGIDLEIEKAPLEKFVDNLEIFFQNSGVKLLECDLDKLAELKSFVALRNEIYWEQTVISQVLDQLNDAWDKSNYLRFIRIMNQNSKLPLFSLAQSYKLKYKIAKKKIVNTDTPI